MELRFVYETFVVEERLWNGQTRNGGCYRIDNWELGINERHKIKHQR